MSDVLDHLEERGPHDLTPGCGDVRDGCPPCQPLLDFSPLDGALREVEEETGYTARPGARLLTLAYEVHGRPKVVRYWAAEATEGAFVPNDEVDRILWLPPAAARNRLTHPRDKDLVDALLTAIRRSTVSWT